MQKAGACGSDRVLEEAEAEFRRWRASRPKRERIPDRLWAMAREAASSHGTHRVARRLRLNPARLKEQVAQEQRGNESEAGVEASASRADFLELPVSTGAADRSCVLEVQSASGARMRIELRGEATVQAESMARLLWEGRP